MGDHQHVSEEMVKLIFTPLRESLADTTNAIKESSNELRNLFKTISEHPDKSDLKDVIDRLVETVKYDFTNKTQLLEVLISTKLRESTDEILDKINKIEPNINQDHEKMNLILELLSKISEAMIKLGDKVDRLLITIGITFTIAMIAWACLSYFFQVNLPIK